MSYRISYSDKFDKSLDKIDNSNAQKILKYLKNHVDGSENPRASGKALTGNLKGLWRYRVGDYRITMFYPNNAYESMPKIINFHPFVCNSFIFRKFVVENKNL
ncbi:hypothetical protein FACS1894178_6450 [Bacteroidia bacterium]|nr:hypothetical protein FACS1894178_6450 [Bacteroidia bacterium]